MKYPEILSIRPEPVLSAYTDKDTMLYALSVGMGADPQTAEREFPFVYEKTLRTLPTFSALLAKGTDKILDGGAINISMILHGEQRLRVHKPLPPAARIRSSARCLNVIDKGAGKGALLFSECLIADADTGEPYCTTIMTLVCRADGGFGGPSEGGLALHEMPTGPHHKEVALRTRPDQALLYRLNGDRNPLHADPVAAKKAGFDKPILHGLCSYAFACRAVLMAYCDFDQTKIRSFDVRFSSPVYPGETIVTRLWKTGPVVSFECNVAERNVTVIKNGRCDLAE